LDRINQERVASLEKLVASPHGPELPEVLYSQAFVGLMYDRSVEESERIFAKVLDLAPGHGIARTWHGIAMGAQGRWREGLDEMQKAAGGEPHSAYLQGITCLGFLWADPTLGGREP
jgi:hypothetical protein